MIPTGLYIRFSGRRHGISIPDQLARLRAEAHAAGELIVAEYVDQARTGNNTRRKDYQRMLADAQVGLFRRIRVESVDRGHRNDFDRRAFEYEMQRYGVQVVYSGEPERRAPPFRKLHRGIRGVVAEFESDETSDRTYKRHLYRAKKGLWRGGPWPYGLKPDGMGWWIPDPESYPVLLWILRQRGQGLGYRSITRALNQGISIDGGPCFIPPTPGLLAYQRKPYLEHQDPETGETTYSARRVPAGLWIRSTVQQICRAAVDGVYAGVYHWGHRSNRFTEYGDGRPKEEVRVDTGKPLIPADVLQKVHVVELMARVREPAAQAAHNRFLLRLRCGRCKQAMHGYTSTKIKPSGKRFRYRKYRCAGRANRAGSCSMPMISADAVEQAVLDAVFSDVQRFAGNVFLTKLTAAVERKRAELLRALDDIADELRTMTTKRDHTLDTLTTPHLPPSVRAALLERVEETLRAVDRCTAQQHMLQAGLNSLNDQAGLLQSALSNPRLDPTRWHELDVFHALKQALALLVYRMELTEVEPHTYVVDVWLYDLSSLVGGRETVVSESAWESNPPARLVTPPDRFEDGGQHRPTSALIPNATRPARPRQAEETCGQG